VVDRLPIVVPVGIRGSGEDVGDVAPLSPRPGNCGNQSRPWLAGHRDGEGAAVNRLGIDGIEEGSLALALLGEGGVQDQTKLGFQAAVSAALVN
jgi:hypothetical protein